jgi:WD40 repeat protein
MHVTVTCPQCDRQLRLPREVVGSTVRCPLCQAVFLTRSTENEGAEAVNPARPPAPKPASAVPHMELDDLPLAPLIEDPIPVAPRPSDEDVKETYDLKDVDESPDRRAPPRGERRLRRRDASPPPPPPATRARPGAPDFPTVAFAVRVVKDPHRRLDGQFQVEVRPDGFRMWRGQGRVLYVAPDGKAEHLGGSRFAIEINEGRRVELTVVGGDAPGAFLAKSVADFIRGEIDEIRLPAANPWPVVPLAAAPLGIPLFAVLLGNGVGGTVGGVLWGALALALAGFCLLVAFSRWSLPGRVLASAAAVAMGYVFLAFCLVIDLAAAPSAVNPASWAGASPQGGGYTVRLPPRTSASTRPLSGFKGSGLQITGGTVMPQNAWFAVGHGDFDDSALTAQQRLFLVQQSLMQTSGTWVVDQRDISLGGRSGREIVGRGPGEAQSLLRIYTSDKRLYFALAGCSRKKDVPALSAFLDSFQLDPAREAPVDAGPRPGPVPGPGPGPGPRPPEGDPKPNTDLGPGGLLFDGGGKSFVWAGFTNNGRTILGVAKDGTARLWNAGTGAVEQTLETRWTEEVVHAALSHKANLLAMAGQKGNVRLLTLSGRKNQRILRARARGALWCVAFSPDGTTLATGHGNHEVVIWRVSRGTPQAELKDAKGQVLSLAFSSDGSTLAAGDSERVARLYQMPAGKLAASCTGHKPPDRPFDGVRQWTWNLRSVALSRDGRTLATASNDNTARLWDAATGLQKRVLDHGQAVTAVAFHPAGRIVLTACADGRIRAWEAATGHPRGAFRTDARLPAGLIPRSMQVSDDGNTLAVVFGDRVERWDVTRAVSLRDEDRKPLPVLPRHLARAEVGGGQPGQQDVVPLAGSADGSRIAFGGRDQRLRVHDAATLKMQAEIFAGQAPAALAFHPRRALLAMGRGNTVSLLQADTLGEMGFLASPARQNVQALHFSLDGKLLAGGFAVPFGSDPADIRLWDVATRQPVRTFKGNPGGVRGLCFSPDGRTLAAVGPTDRLLRLYEAATGRECAGLVGHTDGILAVAFSPDGKTIASAGKDKSVRLWDVGKYRQAFLLEGHTAAVGRLAFSSDGKTLASGGDDKTVILWDVPSGKRLCRLEHEGLILGLAFGKADDTLLVRANDDSLSRWDLTKIDALKNRPDAVAPDLEKSPGPFVPDLQFTARLEPWLSAVVSPEKGAVLVFTRDRMMLHYSYPEFRLRSACWLGQAVYRSALDASRGLVYAAVAAPRSLKSTGFGRWVGQGDVCVYDVKAILEGKEAPPRLTPAATIPVDGKLVDFHLAGGGRWLCYLDTKEASRPLIGRIDTVARKTAGSMTPEDKPALLGLSPDGKTLYAAGGKGASAGMLQTFDAATFKAVKAIPLDGAPSEMVVGDRFAFIHGSGRRGLGLYFFDLKDPRAGAAPRWPLPTSTIRSAGRKLYALARFGAARIDGFDVPDRPTDTMPAPGARVQGQPEQPLSGDVILSPDGKHLLCTTGVVLRLAGAGLTPPAAPAEEKSPAAGKLKLLSIWKDRHAARVLGLAFSPDGGRLLSGGADRVLVVSRAKDGAFERALRVEGDGMHGVAWSPDGKVWAAGSWGGRTHVVDARQRFGAWPPFARRPLRGGALALGVDVLSFNGNGTALVSPGEKGLQVWTHDTDRTIAMTSPLTGTSVAAATGLAAAGDVSGMVHLFELTAEKPKLSFKAHEGEVRAVQFSLDGRLLASAGVDGKVKVHDAEGKHLRSLGQHEHVVLSLAFAPDGKLVASGGAGGDIRLCNAETGAEVASIPGAPGAPVYALAFSPDGKSLAAACGREVMRWDTSGLIGPLLKVEVPGLVKPPEPGPAAEKAEVVGRGIPFHDAALDEKERVVYVVNASLLRRSGWPNLEPKGTYRFDGLHYRLAVDAAAGRLYTLRASIRRRAPDGKSRAENPELEVYDLKALPEGKRLPRLIPLQKHRLEGTISQIVLSPDGRSLYYLDLKEGKLCRFDTAARKVEKTLALEAGARAFCLTPDGRTIYAASSSGAGKGKIQVIDAAKMEATRKADLKLTPFDLVATDAGRVVVSGTVPGRKVLLLDANTDFAVLREHPVEAITTLSLAARANLVFLCPRKTGAVRVGAWALPADGPPHAAVEFTANAGRGLTGGDPVASADGSVLLSGSGAAVRVPPRALGKGG